LEARKRRQGQKASEAVFCYAVRWEIQKSEDKRKEGKSLLFVNKKKQKNFFLRCLDAGARPLPSDGPQMDKSFFQKKNRFLAFCTPSHTPA
jgi:hypothetical protein